MLGVFFYLSQAVQAPEEHLNKGYVTKTVNQNGQPFNWADLLGDLLTIKSQEREPKEAFIHVRYRDYWYYVENSDLNSKDTLGLLSYLSALQSAEGKGSTPLLIIS